MSTVFQWDISLCNLKLSVMSTHTVLYVVTLMYSILHEPDSTECMCTQNRSEGVHRQQLQDRIEVVR